MIFLLCFVHCWINYSPNADIRINVWTALVICDPEIRTHALWKYLLYAASQRAHCLENARIETPMHLLQTDYAIWFLQCSRFNSPDLWKEELQVSVASKNVTETSSFLSRELMSVINNLSNLPYVLSSPYVNRKVKVLLKIIWRCFWAIGGNDYGQCLSWPPLQFTTTILSKGSPIYFRT